jgi:hypothetical protein
MSVVSVTRMIALTRGDSAIDALTEQWSLQESYHVVVTNGTTEDEVLGNEAIPAKRAAYTGLTYFRVVDRQARRLSPVLWQVDVTYRTLQGTGGAGGTESPLMASPTIEYDSEVSEDDVSEDVEGEPIIFVTGEEIDPPLREERHTPLILIERPVLWVNPEIIADYRNKYNSDLWYGNPPGTCLMRKLKAKSVRESDFEYFMVSAAIAIKRGAPNTSDAKAWWRRVRAQGYRVKIENPFNPGETKLIHAQIDGVPVTRPVLHDKETGMWIRNNAEAQWYEWDTKGGRPFNSLGLTS